LESGPRDFPQETDAALHDLVIVEKTSQKLRSGGKHSSQITKGFMRKTTICIKYPHVTVR